MKSAFYFNWDICYTSVQFMRIYQAVHLDSCLFFYFSQKQNPEGKYFQTWKFVYILTTLSFKEICFFLFPKEEDFLLPDQADIAGLQNIQLFSTVYGIPKPMSLHKTEFHWLKTKYKHYVSTKQLKTIPSCMEVIYDLTYIIYSLQKCV